MVVGEDKIVDKDAVRLDAHGVAIGEFPAVVVNVDAGFGNVDGNILQVVQADHAGHLGVRCGFAVETVLPAEIVMDGVVSRARAKGYLVERDPRVGHNGDDGIGLEIQVQGPVVFAAAIDGEIIDCNFMPHTEERHAGGNYVVVVGGTDFQVKIAVGSNEDIGIE